MRRLMMTHDLLRREPDRQRRWAAVLVDGRFLRREQRVERVETTVGAQIGAPPAAPDRMLERPVHHRYFRSVDPEPQRCSHCALPGRMLCAPCGGSGWVSTGRSGNEAVRCTLCGGDGQVACSVCGGSGRAVRAEAVYITDHVDHLHRVYLPSACGGPVFQMESWMRAFAEPPEALRFALEQRSASGPYRGAPVRDPGFHGHEFGDALQRAQGEMRFRMAQRPLRQAVRSFAWPFLELSWWVWGRTFHALFVHAPSGAPQVFLPA